MSCENKKYAVVKFLSDSTYSEIPTAWLFKDKEDIQQCWWPPRTANSATLIINCESPDSTWNSYEVDIFRKNAADSNYSTTDEERLGRGKRQRILYSRFSDEEEYDHQSQPRKYTKKKQIKTAVQATTNTIQQLPSCPPNLDFINKEQQNKILKINNDNRHNKIITSQNEEENELLITTDMGDKENEYSNLYNVPIILQGNAPPIQNLEDISNIKDSIQQMLRMQAVANITLKDLQQRLLKIERAIKHRALSPEKINDDVIAPFLPLTTIELIKEFDALLKISAEAVRQFKEFLSKTGGNNARDNIHRILRKTLTNECSMKCSWKGLRNNFRVSNLHFIKMIKRQVTSHYTTCTETEFENIVAEWLRFATQRNKRERAKENIDGNNSEEN
ncbi:uncharacterized protein LOC115241895, partial [Formica exsecta]|uniref:uncharacterized protein LOC115241895 n=1 Tax=Formica exsecta TaxID=72781 RepID=UPI001141D331